MYSVAFFTTTKENDLKYLKKATILKTLNLFSKTRSMDALRNKDLRCLKDKSHEKKGMSHEFIFTQ